MENEMYKRALEELNLVLTLDRDGMVTEANENFCHLVRFSRPELIGQHYRQLYSGCHHSAFLRELVLTLRSGRAWRGEICLLAKTEKLFWVHAVIYPRLDARGKITGFFCVGQDLTVRKNHEVELERSEERNRFIAKATNDAVYDWNMLTDNLQWYNIFFEMFGFQPEEIEPTIAWWEQHLHPQDREITVACLNEAIAQKQNIWRLEYRFRCRGGQYKYVYERGYILYREDGTPYRMIGSVQDIQALKEQQLKVSEQNELLQEIAFSQSHVVRKPVANILGLLSCMDYRELSAENREVLDYLQAATRELDHIIRDIVAKTEAAGEPAGVIGSAVPEK